MSGVVPTNQPAPAPRRPDDVPGWLRLTDQLLFSWLLRQDGRGDLLELGVFQGRSAIHMGRYLRAGETFTVCDLFDGARDEKTIRPGARRAYRDLTQEVFERNYLAFHARLPVIVRGLTSVITDHVPPASCRFIHIDASHMYHHVRADAAAARQLLLPDGVVVFDDYRTEHCPGTAAAVWEAMAVDGLKVVCVSANKFYGTWGDPTALQEAILERVAAREDHRVDVQMVMGQRLPRIVRLPKAPAATGGRITRQGSVLRRAAFALLPDPAIRTIRRARAHVRASADR